MLTMGIITLNFMVPKKILLSFLDWEVLSIYWAFNNTVVSTSLPLKLILYPASCYDLPEFQNPQRCSIRGQFS